MLNINVNRTRKREDIYPKNSRNIFTSIRLYIYSHLNTHDDYTLYQLMQMKNINIGWRTTENWANEPEYDSVKSHGPRTPICFFREVKSKIKNKHYASLPVLYFFFRISVSKIE